MRDPHDDGLEWPRREVGQISVYIILQKMYDLIVYLGFIRLGWWVVAPNSKVF